jgi:hypothetical protein
MKNDAIHTPEPLNFNRAQRNFVFNLPRTKNGKCIWSRGTGKSTIIAWLMHVINIHMPRSCWNLQGATFQQILTRTLPGTLGALEGLGYQKDRDYFINKFPNSGYHLPYQAPAKAENCLFLVNHKNKCAVGFALLSQDRSSSRGPNRDGCICDESLLLDIDKFNAETKPTIRGNRQYFNKQAMHHGIFHFTSMPYGESFLFEGSEYYEEEGNNSLALREKVADLQYEFVKETDKVIRLEMWSEILELEKGINFYAKNRNYYSEFTVFDNIRALGLNYVIDQLKDSTELLFKVEILNKRIGKLGNSFYAYFDKNHHGYKGSYNYSHIDTLDYNFEKLAKIDCRHDKDCVSNLPLEIGMDFGAAVNWLTVAQELRSLNQFNVINAFFVKSPKIIDDVVKAFCNYYEHHACRTVYYYADAEGNSPRANQQDQTTYNQQVIKLLRDNGWNVINKATTRTNPHHDKKYITYARMLNARTEHKSRYPVFRINLINCKALIISMENTPTKDTGGRVGKDKSSEKNFKKKREQATDGGDSLDQIVYGKYAHLLDYSPGFLSALS